MMDPDIQSKTNGSVKAWAGDCIHLVSAIESESVDLIVSSPPYCIGKEYESLADDMASFEARHIELLPKLINSLKVGGSLCWQVGHHVKNGESIPLDIIIYNIISEINERSEQERMILRNRIVWTFGHGLHAKNRFSGRHETILWFTKGNVYDFNLDEVRVPQKYPGKTHHKGPKKGQLSGNPRGKNPSDVWDIPNVKANHVEKLEHPCQFPVALPLRLIKALTDENDLVLDPYMGTGSTAIAALIANRKFIGAEIDKKYFQVAKERIASCVRGELRIREDIPVMQPNRNHKVASKPNAFY